ncbi:hypothetical protein Bca4012_074775 [Brassica carinata]|uniref:Myb/SANT-like domain-containing protein n=1 Tax=Brassica carinata TaxID=52824 RepID=A0A8X7QN19_BRACI|nr:hypothetical protein Bca52824_067072 [Brassica carinata]
MASNQEESQENNKVTWTNEMTHTLLKCIIVEKQSKDEGNRFFNLSQKENIVKKLNEQFGIEMSWKHAKNRWDYLKKFYNMYKMNPENPRLGTNFFEYVAQLDEIFGDY